MKTVGCSGLDFKVFGSDLKDMEVLCEQGAKYAKEIVDILSDRVGWNKIEEAK